MKIITVDRVIHRIQLWILEASRVLWRASLPPWYIGQLGVGEPEGEQPIDQQNYNITAAIILCSGCCDEIHFLCKCMFCGLVGQ